MQACRISLGGAGFIGHNLTLHLAGLGARVAVIDGLQINDFFAFVSSGENVHDRDLYLTIVNSRLEKMRVANVELYVLDVRAYHAYCELINELNPEVVIHLAADSHAGKSNKDPFSTFVHSLQTLENALDAARSSVEHFIYVSSSMVYGNFLEGKVSEESTCSPLGIYRALKYADEKMVIAYNQVFDLPYTIIRSSAQYGERCVSRPVGQIFIENALKGLDVCVVDDGSDRLDFTYIQDLVHGFERVIEGENSRGETFNLTFGQSRSIGGWLN